MAPGELAALAGFLSQVRPQVALTIGAMASGALAMIADQAAEVHAFEAGAIATHRDVPPNVEVHSGQRGVHGFLAAMSARGASIGLVFIDGGQVTETLPRTVESVLSSAAVDSGLVLVHGSANDAVRAGLEGVAYRGVAHADLDCLAGRVQAQGPLAGELVGGLALMVVDSNANGRDQEEPRYYETQPLLAAARDRLCEAELGELAARRAHSAPLLALPESIPAMTTAPERRFYRWFMSRCYSATGAAVELGSWLGSSTVALAQGLALNRRASGRGATIWAYDRFIWEEWMDEHVVGSALAGKLQPGQSFLPSFRELTDPWRDLIEPRQRDLARETWSGGPIEFLFIDAMKTPAVARGIATGFFPALSPGVGTVIQQDFVHALSPWVHVLAFRLREYFQPLRWIRGPTSASMAFRLRAEIPATVLEDACRLEIVDELEIDDVYDYAESIVGAAAELRLIAARAMCFASHGLLALARETLERGAALERPLADWDFRTVARRHAPDLERTLAANDAAA